MRSYLTLFSISLVLALVITPYVRGWAIKWGAIDLPDNGRRIHRRPTPRLGGIAIYLAFTLTLLCVPFLGNMVSQSFRSNLTRFGALIIPATFMFAFGIWDDFKGSSAQQKIIAQVIATVMIYSMGFRIDTLSSPFGGVWHLAPIISFPLTALWVVGITNAFNLIDGVDGLAAGASVFALVSILFFSIAQGNPEISLIAVVLVGAVIGFLRYNFNPATIFLGDSGSLFLGFVAAALSLAGSQKGSTIIAVAIPLVSFGLPVVEAGLSLVRRFLGGDSLLAGDRGHIHHMLLRRGFSQRQVVIVLYAVCALFSLFGLMLLNPQRSLAALIFFILGIGILFGVQHLRYAEFSELGSQIRRGVLRHRRAMAVNVRVRRTTADLGGAKNVDQFFAALDAMLDEKEFDCAVLEVERISPPFLDSAARFAHITDPQDSLQVIWAWEARGVRLSDVFSSRDYWTLKVPLSGPEGESVGAVVFYRALSDDDALVDLRNICGPLQRELGAALVRLMEMEDEVAARQ